MENNNFIEINLGIGMNMFFPEYIRIDIPKEDMENKEDQQVEE